MGVYIDLNKTVIINFGFDLPKSFEEHLEHEIESIIRRNGFLAEQRIKIKTDQLLFKYKHGNDIHEHRKQQNE